MRKSEYRGRSGQQTNRGDQQKPTKCKMGLSETLFQTLGHDIHRYPHLRIISDRFCFIQNRLNLGKTLITVILVQFNLACNDALRLFYVVLHFF